MSGSRPRGRPRHDPAGRPSRGSSIGSGRSGARNGTSSSTAATTATSSSRFVRASTARVVPSAGQDPHRPHDAEQVVARHRGPGPGGRRPSGRPGSAWRTAPGCAPPAAPRARPPAPGSGSSSPGPRAAGPAATRPGRGRAARPRASSRRSSGRRRRRGTRCCPAPPAAARARAASGPGPGPRRRAGARSAPATARGTPRPTLQQAQGPHDEVVEVHAAALGDGPLVGDERARHGPGARIREPRRPRSRAGPA